MELNILVRGQSNAQLMMDAEGGAGQQMLIRRVEQLLGFDGVRDRVALIYGHPAEEMATVAPGTALMTDWLSPVEGDWRNGWWVGAREAALLNFIAAQPEEVRDNPTAVLWLHNEYDAIRADVTEAMWASAVRFDAALLRQALGQGAETVPYVFVSAIPSSSAVDGSLQAIRLAMEGLAGDASFNAMIGARALDLDMSWDDLDGNPGRLEFGGTHMAFTDALLVIERAARSIAEGWAQYALPGSEVARRGGDIANEGPQAVAARRADWNLLEVDFAFDGAGILVAQPIVGTGLGWTVRDAVGRSVAATGLSPVDGDTVLIHFDGALPEGPLRLHYGWGYGRLADDSGKAQGNALYDEQGLPAWTMAQGLGVIGWENGRGILDHSDAALRPTMLHGLTVSMMSRAEEARFLDGRMVFDLNDPAAQALRLYQAALGRLPDAPGLDYWTDGLKAGWALEEVGHRFLESAEFQARYGQLGNASFVEQLYWNVLGREADDIGRDYWLEQLGGSRDRGWVLQGFSESGENRARTAWQVEQGLWDADTHAAQVARLYDTALGRRPDAEGLKAYVSAMKAGLSMTMMAADFLRSAEFEARYGMPDNAAFVSALYRSSLHREADAQGMAHWVSALEGGMTRAEAVLGFSESAEHMVLTQSWVLGDQQGGYGILFA